MRNTTLIQILVLCIITYLFGIFCVPLIDIDATQYASISREMLLSKNYLQLYDLGKNYLDKPPMLFWLSSTSLYIFGMHDWAFRLPSFLFSLLAIYSTYRFALLYYRKEIALLAAVVLASCQAMFLINHDVRTDTMLMGWVAFSMWQLASWYQFNKWKNLVLAAIAIAGGMMTKGPITLMIPVFAFAPHFLLTRNWKEFARWQYIPLLLIIALLLVPMSIGLYQQYDMHPGKVVAGITINSGLRFFYWTQSFGRITGESSVKEKAFFLFLFQNMLWSFLPWILLFIVGLFAGIKEIIQQKFSMANRQETITLSGFIITYCAMGSSQYQLPHYIFVVFPFAEIITANFLFNLLYTDKWSGWKKPLLITHSIIFALLWVVLMALISLPFATIPLYVKILAACCFTIYLILVFLKKISIPKILLLGFFTSIGLNIFLNTAFYPSLLQYQTGNIAAKYIADNKLPKDKVFVFGEETAGNYSLYFYGGYIYKKIESANELTSGDYVFTSQKNYTDLVKSKPSIILFTGKGFTVSQLTFPFLNPATRDSALHTFYIAKVN